MIAQKYHVVFLIAFLLSTGAARAHEKKPVITRQTSGDLVSLCIVLSAGITDPNARGRELGEAIRMEGRSRAHLDAVLEMARIAWPPHEYGVDPRFYLLGRIAAEYASLGLFDDALAVIRLIGDTEVKESSLETVAGSMLDSGLVLPTERLLPQFATDTASDRIRARVALRFMESGDLAGAGARIAEIVDPERRGEPWTRLAGRYAEAGDRARHDEIIDRLIEAAEAEPIRGDTDPLAWQSTWWHLLWNDTHLTVAQRKRLHDGLRGFADPQYRIAALSTFAQHLRTHGDTSAAAAVLRDAAESLTGSESDWRYADNLTYVAYELMELGEVDAGFSIVKYAEAAVSSWSFPGIPLLLARRGRVDDALTLADSMTWPAGRSEAYQKIAAIVADRGDTTRARELFAGAEDLLSKIDDATADNLAFNYGELAARAHAVGLREIGEAAASTALECVAAIAEPQRAGPAISSLARDTGFTPMQINRALDLTEALIDSAASQYWATTAIEGVLTSPSIGRRHLERILDLTRANRWDYNWLSLLPDIAGRLHEDGDRAAAVEILQSAVRMTAETRLSTEQIAITLEIADKYVMLGETASALLLADSALHEAIWLPSEVWMLDITYEDIAWRLARWGYFSQALEAVNYIFNPDRIPGALRRVIAEYKGSRNPAGPRRELNLTEADRSMMMRIAEKRTDPHWR